MRNRLFFLLILCLLGFCSPAQINVSLDLECLLKNSAIVGRSLIAFAGRDSVNLLLENNVNIVFNWKMDSLGRVAWFLRGGYRGRNLEYFPVDFFDRFTIYLQNNKICFDLCPPLDPTPDSIQLITRLREYFKEGRLVMMGVGFPGRLMSQYNSVCKKAEKDGRTLSQVEYLEAQIKKILSEE